MWLFFLSERKNRFGKKADLSMKKVCSGRQTDLIKNNIRFKIFVSGNV